MYTKRIFFFLNFLLILSLNAYATSWKWIVYGDTRTNDARHRDVLQSIINNTPDYKFIINVGDVVANGTRISDWETWQAACNDILGGTGQDQVPPKYMACPGNHDKCNEIAGLVNWNIYLPGQAQLYGNDGKYFIFDYKDARFIILDSDALSMVDEQNDMLFDSINNNPKTWLFTFWHRPIFDFGDKHYEENIHNIWGVPLYRNGCDIMFMGHAHYYVRSKKLVLNGEKNPPLDPYKGTVQVVTGNGGASLDDPDPNYDGNGYLVASHLSPPENGYTELTIDENTMHLRHILRDGTIFDEADYTANPKSNTTSLNEDIAVTGFPTKYKLHHNYPNPFNVSTTIRYDLPAKGRVILRIYNITGRLVSILVDGLQDAGTYKLTWESLDFDGKELTSGIYFCHFQTESFEKINKMILVR